MCPLFHQLSPLQHQDAVGHSDGGEPVLDEDRHPSFSKLAEP
jgi:hypothetical protein